MARVVFSRAVETDSRQLFTDLEREGGAVTVLKYRGLFRSLFERLEGFPESGAPRPRLGSNIRLGVVDPYVVIHRYDESVDAVQVLQILHGKRNITKRLLKGRA